MSGIVGSVARGGGAGLAGVVGAQAVGGAVVGAAGGALFGLAYGTAIRIGYEQIYPALFPDGKPSHDLIHILDALEQLFDFVGGKAAHIFGVEQGVQAHTSIETQNFTYGDIRKEDSLTFLDTLDKFFKSITPLPQAFGHSETAPVNQNLAQTFSQDKAFNDAIASQAGDATLIKDFRDKISNYNYALLQTLLKTETDHAKRSVIIALINATPEAFQSVPTLPPTEDQLRKVQITESGLSPLAYQARETFKANIDEAVKTMNHLTSPEMAKSNQTASASQNLKNAIAAIVLKLSKLRIKYQEVYGVYY